MLHWLLCLKVLSILLLFFRLKNYHDKRRKMKFCSEFVNRWLKIVIVIYDTYFFILLGLQNPGQIKIYSGGILWKRQGGGKSIEVDKADIVSVTWMKVPRSNQLGVQIKDGLFYKITGFRDQVIFCPPEFPFTYIWCRKRNSNIWFVFIFLFRCLIMTYHISKY